MSVGDNGTVGRLALARYVGLGDGAVRTVLKKIRDAGYLRVSASGCMLTKQGRQLYSRVRARLAGTISLEGSPLTIGSQQAAILVRKGGPSVRSGIEQRDAAIKLGALGATTLVIHGSKFGMPGGPSDCEKEYPSPVWKRLRSELSPEEGDALVLCGSDSQTRSRLGSVAAALTLF